MISISRDIAELLGDTASPHEISMISKDLYERLQTNVGMRIADHMDERQLDEFEAYYDAQDDAGAFEWLTREVPEYRAIIQEEWAALLQWFACAAGLSQATDA